MTDHENKSADFNESTVEQTPPDQSSESSLNDESTESEALTIVRNYCIASGAIGFIPVPMVDLAALTGVQLKMLHSLAQVYNVPFKSSWAKSAVASLVGGSAPLLAGRSTASMLKSVPGIGTGLAMITQPALSSACTYAVGKVFIQHFSSGGTFLTFNPAQVREYFSNLFNQQSAEATPETQ
tara:strand:- start:388 stop:933 length:546 start_codon:yes stop_codon:yes gene_type:complete